jgi:hypothetical protein
MLHLVAYLLNFILIATGLFQYLKLELCWAGMGVGIGLVNIVVLYFKRTRGILAAVAAVFSVIAIAQGALLGVSAAQTFSGRGVPDRNSGMWDLIWSGHDFSYAIAYAGAGLVMLVILARERGKGEKGLRDEVERR